MTSTNTILESKKFADMMEVAVDQYAQKHNLKLQKVTKIPLEGEGSIDTRVSKSVCPDFHFLSAVRYLLNVGSFEIGKRTKNG